MSERHSDVLMLRGGGACLILDCRSLVPLVVHWGEDLGPLDDVQLVAAADTAIASRLNATPDEPRRLSVLPTESDAWSGRPAIALSRGGRRLATRFHAISVSRNVRDAEDNVELVMGDPDAAAQVVVSLGLDAHGVLRHSVRVTSFSGDGLLDVEAAHAALPLPARAAEILDFTGKWIGERAPQRLPLSFGTHAREQRRGRTGHDGAFLTVVGTRGFANRSGEVWAMHVAWSGDQGSWVERLPEGAGALASVLSGGELLRTGEVRLDAGETYEAPDVFFVWSDSGLDGASKRFHRRLRARRSHPTSPRPLVLNTWEAVYFDHDLDTLRELADRAADVGVERFVLDDGWFHGRHHDRAGLGDWWVDPTSWPDGLHPLVDHVRGLGMDFGLWVEPEMINSDSDTARAHPEWVLTRADAGGWPSRSQHVLDLTQEDAFAYILDHLDRLVAEYRIDFLKWDHNRDLIEATHEDGRRLIGPHAQTKAVYALIDQLRRRHPSLEIESCASGGARVDLGILDRTDRVWASDCNDPLVRSRIQRWTSLILPPELVGSHVAVAESHTTGRSSGLGFRLATSLFSHAGIEIDLTRCEPEHLEQFAGFAALYKELRPLIHEGSVVNADLDDSATSLRGVVGPDRSRALFCWMQLDTSAGEQPGRVRLPGLDHDAEYVIRVRPELGPVSRISSSGPAWFDCAVDDGFRVHGTVAGRAGLPMPALDPGSVVLFDFVRV